MINQIIKSQKNNNLEKKICNIQNIIQKTILSAQKYKINDILGANELNMCITSLESIFNDLTLILNDLREIKNEKDIINKIENVKSELIVIFKNFGTDSLADMIQIIINDNYIDTYFTNTDLLDKFTIMNQCVHPINFKSMTWKNDNEEIKKKTIHKNRIVEDYMIMDHAENLECFDLARTSKSFQTKVYGIKVSIHDYVNKKTYIIACIVDDILMSCFNSSFLKDRFNSLEMERPNDQDFNIEYWTRFIASLTLKELLVYNNSEIYVKFQGTINQLCLIKQKTVSQVVKEFINSELYGQRTLLIQLLIKSNEKEFQYLAYLLYDLLSNENNGNIDTLEQTLLYDSLPWNIKKCFRNAMKQTIQYTNNLYNFDNNKIPLEQQICLLKASENVKEKAVLKLKEIKSKSEDSGTKARQYLDGLLKIPFGITKEEYILTIMDSTQQIFQNMWNKIKNNTQYTNNLLEIEKEKEKYTNIEILKYCKNIEKNYVAKIIADSTDTLISKIKCLKKDHILKLYTYINHLIKSSNLDHPKLVYSAKKMTDLQNTLCKFIENNKTNYNIINNIYTNNTSISIGNNPTEYITPILDDTVVIERNINTITNYMTDVNKTLNSAIYGHEKAKRQIERIIGQWINGEKSGYCFGFEGPPGVGKTSLAKKGIAHCLKDYNGEIRPFSFIAVGGSANGSTLEGHNYTYVGSTWGRIVDILIETKCMNPIIFIDELDKISRTEHGKEIIGILTHLIDPTQNDAFQDKYFSGIDLDLSKALFIFSYNDVECIDRILLDRIHRIKFKHLSLEEKLIITKNYILPEIYKKIGFENIVEITDTIIEYIIHTYTNEPGVRKLKEILFEIIGEINLSLLTAEIDKAEFPIIISIDDIKYKYLKDRQEHKIKKIHDKHSMGVINGLWANSVGQGGLLPIEASFLPSTTFLDLKLTGMQGDVMKESMNVARTLAWSLLPNLQKEKLLESFEKTKCQGIHIHVPEGATPKDGPSGGAAITTVIYSLLSEKRINKNFAMTGEICLQGKITAIGGLDLKILGGIESGATKFIYPKDNDKDYKEFYENLKDKTILDNITFYPVEMISEVFKLILIN
jgi:ATP-dependent Lon protease